MKVFTHSGSYFTLPRNPQDHKTTRQRYSQDLTLISSNKLNHFPLRARRERTCAARFLPLSLESQACPGVCISQLKGDITSTSSGGGWKREARWSFSCCSRRRGGFLRSPWRTTERVSRERDGITLNRAADPLPVPSLRQWRRCSTSTFSAPGRGATAPSSGVGWNDPIRILQTTSFVAADPLKWSSSGGRSMQMLYSCKSTNTTLWIYSTASKSPAFIR